MQDKLPERPELDLLIVVTELHAERGAVDRAALQVVARGRGLEVARPLPGLIGAGLVAEITRRPSFLKRLFGARDEVVLAPTEAGRALIAALNGETAVEAAAAEPAAAEGVAPEMPVAVEAAPEEVPVEAPAVPEAAPLVLEPSAPAAPVAEIPVAEIAVTEPLVAQAPAVEVTPVEPAAEDIHAEAAPTSASRM